MKQDEYIYTDSKCQSVDVLLNKDLSLIANLDIDYDTIRCCLHFDNKYAIIGSENNQIIVFSLKDNFKRISKIQTKFTPVSLLQIDKDVVMIGEWIGIV